MINKSKLFPWIDKVFRDVDKGHIRRTKNIRLIPDFKNRRGGKLSYAEWAHVIGIFQTIMYQALEKKTGNKILDIGCGTGLLGISAEPFVAEGGNYTGIDVMTDDVTFCKSHYDFSNYDFIHLNVANATYANAQPGEKAPWPIADESQDLVTALSVWTHLDEKDAIFYFDEIHRVLKNKGRAIVTFFFLDQLYKDSLSKREANQTGRFHSTNQKTWVFDKPAYDSKNWFTIPSAHTPEDAIGVNEEGINLLEKSGLKLINYYPGNWKEIPGVFFQDILIFEKQ